MPKSLLCKWFGCKPESKKFIDHPPVLVVIEIKCKRCGWLFNSRYFENGHLTYEERYQTQDDFLKAERAKANKVNDV